MIQRYSSRRSPLKDFLAAKLMALYGDRPILILVPKPLMIQWQDELWDLLNALNEGQNGVLGSPYSR
jgi:superfamily II DNA or RNA helicase